MFGVHGLTNNNLNEKISLSDVLLCIKILCASRKYAVAVTNFNSTNDK